ncbi:MAG: PH domain-containing protein [Candidatus Onthovivens sp.]|nr:PH domain-containing protein [Candidatus Onthovivens sp.]
MIIQKSLWSEWKKLLICGLLSFLIVPIVIIVIIVKTVKCDQWVISDEKVTHTRGLFSKNEQVILCKNITECSMSENFLGRVFHYGTISLSIIGKRATIIPYCKNPEEVQAELRRKIDKAREANIAQGLVN